MYPLLKSLQAITGKYLFEEKILIVPSYLDGHTLRKNLSYEGFSALNFYSTTLFDIAKEICFDKLIKNGWKLLDNSLGQVLTIQILKDLSFRNKLLYFRLPLITPGLASTIFRTIKEIRVSGYSSDHWPYDRITGSEKTRDLYRIMMYYEEQLHDKRLIDEAKLYTLARKTTTKESKSIYIVPSNTQMNELERQFYHEKIKPSAHIVELFCAEAVAVPHYFSLADFRSAEQCQEKRVFDFLYRREKNMEKLPEVDIKICQTYGEYTEAREVLRTIAEKSIPYDKVQVFYTVQEPYSQYFYQLSDLYQVPMTFHSGISIKNSHPAKLLLSLIDWIHHDYSMARLVFILTGQDIDLKLDEPSKARAFASLLRQSPIGWGRERYIPGIELAIKEREKRISNTSEEKAIRYRKEIQYYLEIKEWIQELFKEIPQIDYQYKVSLAMLARGFGNIIRRYARLEEDDWLGKEAERIIQEKMAILEHNVEKKFPFGEALNLITDMVDKERICCLEPRAGYLHVASYKKGIWMNRPYTFIVGMDSHKFPATSDGATVFLDSEKRLYKQLLTDAQKNRLEQFRLFQLILSTKGKKFLSFSSFNTIDNQEQAPAAILLQLYRLKEKNVEKNYVAFYQYLGEKKKIIPQKEVEILDIGDIFLYFSKQEKRDFKTIFQNKFPYLVMGLKADLERKKGEFNVYNGKIRVIAERVDPRQSRGIVLSSSKLEKIAYCPYLYFLTDILKIKPPEEMVYEPTQWMSPLERGLLLHQIYEKFYKKLLNMVNRQFEPPSFSRHWSILREIAVNSLEEKRKYLAPPGELVYEAEKREILESCQIFLTGEEKNYRGEIPEFFELAFGTRDNVHEVLGKVKAIELTLPDGGKISCQGKIDRIDRLTDGTFRIIDYKTGNSKDYKKGKRFRYGQQIQHALYAIALERILEKNTSYFQPKVSLSGYYFPTAQGQGRLILYGQKNREQVLQIIEILLNVVAQGNFAMIQKPDTFMCQDYQDIMEQNEMIVIDGGKKLTFRNEKALDGLRRLRQFE